MKTKSRRKAPAPTKVRKKMNDRSLDLKITPIEGRDMHIVARIMVNREHADVQYRFDGTPQGEFLRLNEMVAWSNSLKKLITDARDKLAEIRNQES